MFASPNIRIFSQENHENPTQLRSKNKNSIVRKPLADRSNKTSQAENVSNLKEIQAKLNTDHVILNEPVLEDLSDFELYFDDMSHKDIEDNFEDIWAKTNRLSKSDIESIGRAFSEHYRCDTPPLVQEDEFELETMDSIDFVSGLNDSGIDVDSGKYEISMIEEDDISLPEIDLDFCD